MTYVVISGPEEAILWWYGQLYDGNLIVWVAQLSSLMVHLQEMLLYIHTSLKLFIILCELSR